MEEIQSDSYLKLNEEVIEERNHLKFKEKPQREHASPHILAASASLLGLCFLVLTSIRLLELSSSTHIDEFSSFALFLFVGSSVFSFWSMRSIRHKGRLDSIAAYMFFSGLLMLFIITLVVTLRNV